MYNVGTCTCILNGGTCNSQPLEDHTCICTAALEVPMDTCTSLGSRLNKKCTSTETLIDLKFSGCICSLAKGLQFSRLKTLMISLHSNAFAQIGATTGTVHCAQGPSNSY